MQVACLEYCDYLLRIYIHCCGRCTESGMLNNVNGLADQSVRFRRGTHKGCPYNHYHTMAS
jgi:hypothetical protein